MEAWMEVAACKDGKVDFYGHGVLRDRASRILTMKAKAVCETCEVKGQCLSFALANNEVHGIWGGLTERERETYRRSLKK